MPLRKKRACSRAGVGTKALKPQTELPGGTKWIQTHRHFTEISSGTEAAAGHERTLRYILDTALSLNYGYNKLNIPLA